MTEERDPAWSHFYPPVTRQSLRDDTAAFRLDDAVLPEVRERFERALATYHPSYDNYGLVAQSAEQAMLVIEQAVRTRLQECPARAALIHAADNGLPPFDRPRPISLQNLLEMAVADGLLSRQWDIPFICERRNFIAHGRETVLINEAVALQIFSEVVDLVNELWGERSVRAAAREHRPEDGQQRAADQEHEQRRRAEEQHAEAEHHP